MDNNQKSWPHHSEHIFILPLKWDVVARIDWFTYRRNRHATPLDKRLRMADVVASLVENDAWEMMYPVSDIIGMTAKPDEAPESFFGRFLDPEDSRLYKEYCFFYSNVRNLLYNQGNELTPLLKEKCKHDQENTSFPGYAAELRDAIASDHPTVCVLERKTAGGSYILQGKGHSYELLLNSMELRIYDSGTMLLSFHCVNDSKPSLSDITRINCWGRRLYSPYFWDVKESGTLKGIMQSDDAPETSYMTLGKDQPPVTIFSPGFYPVPEHLPFLHEILAPNFISYRKAVLQSAALHETNVVLDPNNDERMFVHSYVVNPYLPNAISSLYPRRAAFFESESKFANSALGTWYALLVGDEKIQDPTCQSKERALIELEEYTYDRWLVYGTFYGITENSFMMLVSPGAPDHLQNSFTWIYKQLSMIALLHRTSLLRFYEEASGALSNGGDQNTSDKLKRIQQVRAAYLRFLNCIWFREVTAQRQGQELFDKLCENMTLERDVAFLDQALEEMSSYEQGQHSAKLDRNVWWLTIIGALFMIVELFGLNDIPMCDLSWGLRALFAAAFATVVFIGMHLWTISQEK